MKFHPILAAALSLSGVANSSKDPRVVDDKRGVTYEGINRNGVELFLGVPFGEDTSGANRFKPPRVKKHARGTVVKATSYGHSCPQLTGSGLFMFALSPITDISEDCLNLVIGRPKGTTKHSRLPVMVWIYGGGLWVGQNREITTSPDGLVLESIKNGLPVISISINYRLGIFGFAQSSALNAEGSENAGLRDQRLALEWIRHHIAQFGGDPDKITIFGQSSGGLSVGMQIMAYGGTKPAPFQQGICHSQANEPGITANFTIDAMKLVVDAVGCNESNLHSAETVECLRNFDMDTLLNASIATKPEDNIGDVWLPVVDGDFLPAAPSKLIKEGRFAKVTTMMGWCQDDVTLFTDTSISTEAQTRAWLTSYIPTLSPTNVDKLLSLYPVSDFPANPSAGMSSQFYRTARIFRDILMTCMPLQYSASLARHGNTAYLYDWNQTTGDQIIQGRLGKTGYGVVHTSDVAYVFGNISVYKSQSYPYEPLAEDYALQHRASRSWSTFASTGRPSLRGGHATLEGFTEAYPVGKGKGKGEVDVYVIGGPEEGISAIDGPRAKEVIERQRLRERCAFLNSDEVVEQLRY